MVRVSSSVSRGNNEESEEEEDNDVIETFNDVISDFEKTTTTSTTTETASTNSDAWRAPALSIKDEENSVLEGKCEVCELRTRTRGEGRVVGVKYS